MTITLELTPTTAVTEDRPQPEAPETRVVPPKAMDEFVALLAQAYVLMPLFP
jgi:hypothetical protein